MNISFDFLNISLNSKQSQILQAEIEKKELDGVQIFREEYHEYSTKYVKKLYFKTNCGFL